MHFMLDMNMHEMHVACMKKLREYIDSNSMTMADFGQRVGVSQSQVSRLLSGGAKPSLETIRQIKRVTNGEITADDWIDELEDEATAPVEVLA